MIATVSSVQHPPSHTDTRGKMMLSFVVRTFSTFILLVAKYTTAVLTVLTMLYITSLGVSYLITEKFVPCNHFIQFPQVLAPASGNRKSGIFLLVRMFVHV